MKLRLPAVLATLCSAYTLLAGCRGSADKPATVAQAGDTVTATGLPLNEPYIAASDTTAKLLDVAMSVKSVSLPVAGLGVRTLRTYVLTAVNGKQLPTPIVGFPGPTLLARPGDSVRIALTNSLDPDPAPHTCASYAASADSVDKFPNCFHGLNTTNLHFHGFHLPVDPAADDPFVEIAPQTTYQYAFRIPATHPTGTFWYHPHKHGSAALQLLNGMSGAFIVYGGPLDRLNKSLNMREHLIAIQQVDSQLVLMVNNTSTVQPASIVNAQSIPVVYMRPGEVQRWRIVNENVSTATSYSLLFSADTVQPRMWDIARDGLQYNNVNYQGATPDTSSAGLALGPGNRLDVYVQAPPKAGKYALNAVLKGRVPGLRRRLQANGGTLAAAPAAALLTVQVVDTGSAKFDTILPPTLPRDDTHPRYLAATSKDTTFLMFTQTTPPTTKSTPPPAYLGTAAKPQQQFDPTSVFLQLPLGDVQTWKISSTDVNISHPFHIHVNPFQVLQVSYGPNDPLAAFYKSVNDAAYRADSITTKYPLWMDTFQLPLAWVDSSTTPYTSHNGSIVIRQRYTDFAGYTVMHCHILGHEERGMMQRIQILRVAGRR